jgi:hypothetical protein
LEKERNYEFFSKRKWLSYPKFSVLSLHSLGCCVILSTKLEKERELSWKPFLKLGVFMQTNRTTARIFPAVLDVENPEFKRKLDKMVEINQKLIAIGETNELPLVKNFKRIPLVAALASELLAAYLMPPIESGSVDIAEFEPQLVY